MNQFDFLLALKRNRGQIIQDQSMLTNGHQCNGDCICSKAFELMKHFTTLDKTEYFALQE